MKASILAIGTELTAGQIINRNAARISEKLKSFGVETNLHLTVPDRRDLILKALDFVSEQSHLIFVTGGLGPTSDDFTREVVADWSKLPLEFNEASWTHIVDRLTSRGFQVREMQKQQCYFPKGSEILTNAEGTAHGFSLEVKQNSEMKKVFVLPGPPREIERVWSDHIETWMRHHTKNLDRLITKAWDTIGVGESDIAYLVEAALKDLPNPSALEIGYRVHLPYVEVKLTFKETDKNIYSAWVEKVDQALKNSTVTRDFLDVTEDISDVLSEFEFTFYDYVSQGYLHHRLNTSLKKLNQWSFKQSLQKDITPDFFENEDHFLALLPYKEDQCLVLFSLKNEIQQVIIEAPMKSALMSERRRQYFSEMALVALWNSIKS